ncbi:MAG: flagellar filament outer layer protein FlaA [Treponema sp.]|nr:flagellar filament outer layer protein FlaA [Treponema sp.]
MKHVSIRAVCFVGLMCLAVLSAHGRDRTETLSTVVLESFNGETTREWSDGGQMRTFDFAWDLRASGWATTVDGVSFPRSTFVEAWPRALFGGNREGRLIQSFGVNGRFDRQGHNWIDVFPVQDGEAFEIPMPGRVRSMDMWVWGSNLQYRLEAYLRDAEGYMHRIQLGSLAFDGWRNLSASIPSHIRQENRVLPAHARLSFVKFRLWTQPNERSDNFFVYFNRLNILTDMAHPYFDGDDLANPDLVSEFWND